MTILVLALGNILLSDDGIGIQVINTLRKKLSPADPVELIDGGTLSFTLAVPLAAADALIVIDAAQLMSAPGTVSVFIGTAMDDFLVNQRRTSVHELSLIDLRAIAQLTGSWPEKRALIAIQPEKISWGEFPTPRVSAAIPIACAQIQLLIAQWQDLARAD